MLRAKDVEATGGNYKTLSKDLIDAVNIFQAALPSDYSIAFLKNGFNSGKHDGEYHPKGMAVDFVVKISREKDSCVLSNKEIFEIIAIMILAGFDGIGVYWNRKVHSFHGDVRGEYAQWSAVKTDTGKWKYMTLIDNPRWRDADGN
jgi:hypothetical protein